MSTKTFIYLVIINFVMTFGFVATFKYIAPAFRTMIAVVVMATGLLCTGLLMAFPAGILSVIFGLGYLWDTGLKVVYLILKITKPEMANKMAINRWYAIWKAD